MFRSLIVAWLIGRLAGASASAQDPFADGVHAYAPGTNGGFSDDALPDVLLGPPRGAGALQGSFDVLALGIGGSIVVGFDLPLICDGPGPDFTVFENAFHSGSPTGPVFAEYGFVAVSQDGVNFLQFPHDAGTKVGLAGKTPVLTHPDNGIDPLDPNLSGGDPFDLAIVGLSWAAYVRVTDVAGAVTDPGDLPQFSVAPNAGFDLDAVAALHACDPSSLATPTPTFTATIAAPTATATPAPSFSPSPSPTHTATGTPTHTATFTPPASPTFTPSESPTFTPPASPTATPTASPTPSRTATPSLSPTETATIDPTATATAIPTDLLSSPTATATPSATPTIAPDTPTASPTSTFSATAASTETVSATASASPEPSANPTPPQTATPPATPSPTATGTSTAVATPTASASATATTSATATATADAPIPGDVNGDGTVAADDLTLLIAEIYDGDGDAAAAAAGGSVASGPSADANRDGRISAADPALLRSMLGPARRRSGR